MPGFALENPTYQPALRLINNITNAPNALVTTSFDHDYLPGLIVRLLVSSEFGMVQANQLVGTILSTPALDSFIIDINTSNFDVFSAPIPEPWYVNDFPAVVPVGEINSSLNQATRNVL